MELQVLVATMHQVDHSLLDKMNIQSDAIIGNQCDRNEIEEFEHNGHKIKYLSFAERGVGLNRNNILMRATADICVFADDDVIYINGYKDKIIKEFQNHPEADIIIFNVLSTNTKRKGYSIERYKKIGIHNYMRYGTVRVAARVKSIQSSNIYFSLLFGGGAKYSHGEDTLFLADCIKKRLKIYASPIQIGTVSNEESTWFKGYTDKFFKDQGVLYYHISKRWAKLLCLQFAIRRRKMFREDKTMIEAYRLMLEGIEKSRYP